MRTKLLMLSLLGATGLVCLCAGYSAAARLSGVSRTSFDYSWADAEEEEDETGALFTQYLRAEADQLPYGMSVFGSGSLKWDADGEEEGSIFYSDANEKAGDTRFYLYEAGVRVAPAKWGEATLGRFNWLSAERVHIDGGAVSLHPRSFAGLKLEAFGGRVAELYDELEREEIYGFGAEVPMLLGTRLEVDFMEYIDTLLKVALDGGWSDVMWARGEAKWVGGDLRDAKIRLIGYIDATGTRVTGGFKKRFADESNADYLFDYTADAAAESRYRIERLNLEREADYNQYELAVEQEALGFATVSARYIKRDLLDEAENESSFNTSFDVVSVGVNLHEPGLEGFYFEARYSWWAEDRLAGHEATSTSWLLAAEQEFTDAISAHASWYSKEEDINNELENQVADALTLGATYRGGKLWKVDADYTRETDDTLEELYGVDSVNTVAARLTVNF